MADFPEWHKSYLKAEEVEVIICAKMLLGFVAPLTDRGEEGEM